MQHERGRDSPGLNAGLSDAGPARPERKEAANLLIAVRGAAGEVEMHRFLTVLGSVTGMKHTPAGAFSSVPMTSSFSRPDRTFQPAPASRTGPVRADRERRRRCGGAGRACRQYVRHPGPYPGNLLFCCERSITGGHATG